MQSIKVEHISPAVAEEMLGRMVRNRPVSDHKVLEYAIAMEQGMWSINAETIKLDREGRLFDGQHRLRACVLSGKTFISAVARGIEDDRAFATVDVGKNRSHADVFGISGFADPAAVASAALIVYLFKNKRLNWRGPLQTRYEREHVAITNKMKRMPNANVVRKDVLLSYAEKISDELNDAVKFSNNCKANKFMPRAQIAGCYLLMSEKSRPDAEQFFTDLGEGVGLLSKDPVYWLRERLIANKGTENRINRWTVIGMVFKTWNKRRAGEQARMMRVVESEEYPAKLN